MTINDIKFDSASLQDEIFLKRTIELALRGTRSVSPNPMVGAVLVYDYRIIAEGWHGVFGGPHAEVHCLNQVMPKDHDLIDKSTLYVSLEPCNHYGQTPPCTNLIIQKNIPKVVIGCVDSNPKVSGSGIEKLKNNGVEVLVANDPSPFLQLIQPFMINHLEQRPFIILKWAQSKDGYLSKKEEQTHISSPESQILVHQWRSEVHAIAIGTQTAIIDNPKLTNRYSDKSNPTRILLDLNEKVPMSNHIFDGSTSSIVFTKGKSREEGNVSWINITEGESLAKNILDHLFSRQLYSVMIEGGAQFINTFIEAKLWDETRILHSKSNLEKGIRAPLVIGKLKEKCEIGHDSLQIILP